MNKKKSLTKIFIFLLAIVLITLFSVYLFFKFSPKSTPDLDSYLSISHVHKTTFKQDEQTFISFDFYAKNNTSKTINGFTAIIRVITPQGDWDEFTCVIFKPIKPHQKIKISQDFEYNPQSPTQKLIYNLPSNQLKFNVRITQIDFLDHKIKL